MSLTNEQITAKNFKEFYAQIRPYLNGQVPPVFNKFSKSDLYSTDEKIIGRWIDGKPLYQKTIEFTNAIAVPSSDWLDSGITVSNGGTVVDSVAMYGTSNTVPWVTAKISSNKLYLNSAVNGSNINKITVKYTKTTDSPVSVGNDTDYSTTEKIVGTWIDGKPIYQKTVASTLISSSGWTDQPHNISNIDFAQIIGFSIANYTLGGTNNNSLMAHVGTVNLEIYNNNSGLYGKTAYVTFQYTKTTD